jgi:putative heme degradation protein
MTLSIQEIQQGLINQRFKSKVRHREVAHSMGISEAELLVAHLGIDTSNTDSNFNT